MQALTFVWYHSVVILVTFIIRTAVLTLSETTLAIYSVLTAMDRSFSSSGPAILDARLLASGKLLLWIVDIFNVFIFIIILLLALGVLPILHRFFLFSDRLIVLCWFVTPGLSVLLG